MITIRSTIAATLVLMATAACAPSANAQGYFHGQGVTGYSYTGFNSTYGSYGFGGIGPMYYGQSFGVGGMYGLPYGGVYQGGMYGMPYGGMYGAPYGGLYGAPYGGAAPMYYDNQFVPYGQFPRQPYRRPTGNGWGAVNGVSPLVPRLDATVPQLSPRVPRLR